VVLNWHIITNHRWLVSIPPRRGIVAEAFEKIPSSFLKILGVGCLVFLLTGPAAAEEQGPKDKTAPVPPPPKEVPTMAPRRAMPKDYKVEETRSRKAQEETLEQKKVTGEVGGQEIRAKPGE
jgi:hypothetical protein